MMQPFENSPERLAKWEREGKIRRGADGEWEVPGYYPFQHFLEDMGLAKARPWPPRPTVEMTAGDLGL